MKTKSHPNGEDTARWILIYILAAFFTTMFGGKLVCFINSEFLFPSDFCQEITDYYFWCFGLLITGGIFIALKDKMFIREKDPLKESYRVNEWSDIDHIYIYKGGRFHVINCFQIKAIETVKLIKKGYTTPEAKPMNVPCLDDELKVWVTLSIIPNGPRYQKIQNPEQACLDFALANIQSILEEYTADKTAVNILGKNRVITEYIRNKINQMSNICNNDFEVEVQIKDMDNSDLVKNAKERVRAAELFAKSVDNFADPANGINKEKAGAMLLADAGKGTYKNNEVDEKVQIFRFEGDPETIKLAKEAGILFGAGREQEEERG